MSKETPRCPGCNADLALNARGRPRIYCSGRCRMRVNRQRLHQDLKELIREHIGSAPVDGPGPRGQRSGRR